ncbi:mCG148457 [Mus musculus]|nr:mCG148457 [Mus musculus]
MCYSYCFTQEDRKCRLSYFPSLKYHQSSLYLPPTGKA